MSQRVESFAIEAGDVFFVRDGSFFLLGSLLLLFVGGNT